MSNNRDFKKEDAHNNQTTDHNVVVIPDHLIGNLYNDIDVNSIITALGGDVNDILFQDSKKSSRNTFDDLELIDPIPDVRTLFVQYNECFFDSKLDCVEVKWSTKMTLCAGLCCYEGRGGLCCIKLSEPLLKFRSRSDIVNTLLHEMIHAYLFVTQANQDHDGHGPAFLEQMKRINELAGSNITVYHNFTDEVELHRQHWWQCMGPCGYVLKRAMNRAPTPKDPWWDKHQNDCGGNFVKIKEPADYGKKKPKTEKPKPEKIKSEGGTKRKKPDSPVKNNNNNNNNNNKKIEDFFTQKKKEKTKHVITISDSE